MSISSCSSSSCPNLAGNGVGEGGISLPRVGLRKYNGVSDLSVDLVMSGLLLSRRDPRRVRRESVGTPSVNVEPVGDGGIVPNLLGGVSGVFACTYCVVSVVMILGVTVRLAGLYTGSTASVGNRDGLNVAAANAFCDISGPVSA